MKASLRDTLSRCICREVGIDSEARFEAKLRHSFGSYLEDNPNIMSQLKRSFQHAARAAELRSAFKSTASVANARRRKPRRLLSTRCERLEQQVAKAIVDAQNRPERKQNRSTGQERLQSRDGQKSSAPQWNRERCPAPEAKDLSSNLLKL